MAKPRRMRSHRSDGVNSGITCWPVACAEAIGRSGPEGMMGVGGAAGASVGIAGVLLVVFSVPTGVAQPVSQSRPDRQAMCRNFIGIRFSMHAGPLVQRRHPAWGWMGQSLLQP